LYVLAAVDLSHPTPLFITGMGIGAEASFYYIVKDMYRCIMCMKTGIVVGETMRGVVLSDGGLTLSCALLNPTKRGGVDYSLKRMYLKKT
jgi:hypothetical protein